MPASDHSPAVWVEPFRVRSYEIGPDARLTLPHLCDWLQEAAGVHATALGVATDVLLAEGRAWVLARLQVEVARYPAWREELTLETWPSAADGLFAQRDFLLHDADRQAVARATSQWFVIDVARRRPVRLPVPVTSWRLAERPHALAPTRDALPEPEAPQHIRAFTVRRSDLDLNRHVNNVRYVEWALEAAPNALSAEHTCHQLDVQFRAESVYGDTVESACAVPEAQGSTPVAHRVSRKSDGRLLAVLQTDWR